MNRHVKRTKLMLCAAMVAVAALCSCFGTRSDVTPCNVDPVAFFGKPYTAADFKIWIVSSPEVSDSMLCGDTPVMDGTQIKEAYVDKNYQGVPMTVIHFDKEGSKVWEQITTENIGRYVAITLGDSLISVPQIMSGITGGVCAVFTETDTQACALSKVLMKR